MPWTMNASRRPSRRVPGSMEGVSNTRRVTKKQNRNARLTLIEGGGRPGRAELEELREQFAASGAPAEVLQVLDASDDVEEALERLLTAGLLPEPEESLAGLLDGWTPTLEAGCDTMAAELFGAEFLGMIGQSIPDDVVLPELLAGLIEQAGDSGTPQALAMMRVLEVLAPPEVRPAAAAPARQPGAARRTGPPRGSGLGTPKVGRTV